MKYAHYYLLWQRQENPVKRSVRDLSGQTGETGGMEAWSIYAWQLDGTGFKCHLSTS